MKKRSKLRRLKHSRFRAVRGKAVVEFMMRALHEYCVDHGPQIHWEPPNEFGIAVGHVTLGEARP